MVVGGDGLPGVWSLLLGFDTFGAHLFPGFGYATVLPLFPGPSSGIGPLPVGAAGDLTFVMPAALVGGVPIKLPALAASSLALPTGGFTNRCPLQAHAW